MDIYIKKAIIHQFSPDDTELFLAYKFLNITPKIEEYLRKKIEHVYSDEAKTGIFEEENPFFNHITDDLLETSVTLANLWKEEFSISENLKTNDLIFVQFSKEGVEHFAFLRIALRETLTHLGGEVDNPIKLTQNNLPGFGTGADEALVVNLQSRKYHLIEKRIKYNGTFLNYFSDFQIIFLLSLLRFLLKNLSRNWKKQPRELLNLLTQMIFNFNPRSNQLFSTT